MSIMVFILKALLYFVFGANILCLVAIFCIELRRGFKDKPPE